jgi:hypothetical protein
MSGEYVVQMPKKLEKTLREMPRNAKTVLFNLVNDIQETGPMQPAYHHYSKLGNETYHCHLAYSWVACWHCENGKYIVEVEYVGSREKAPY